MFELTCWSYLNFKIIQLILQGGIAAIVVDHSRNNRADVDSLKMELT